MNLALKHGPTLGAIILFAAATMFVVFGTAYAIITAQGTVHTLCAEQRDVAVAPISPNTTKFGVTIQAHFRDAYVGLGCGDLPPPSPLLVQLAAKYGVRINH